VPSHHFRVKEKTYGSYSDENEAALARDYAVRRIASLTGSKFRKVNSDEVFLEDPLEKARINKWVNDTFVHAKQDAIHGVTERGKAGGATEYRVRYRINDRVIEFGVFDDAAFARLVADYVSRELLKKEALNFPDRELVGHDQLKEDLRRRYEQARSEEVLAEGSFSAAAKEFWEAVEYGPVYVCCSCHQTWFRKSVQIVTDAVIEKVSRFFSVPVITDVSRWICTSCYRCISQGKIPTVCHLYYDPFSNLPEELQGLSIVENDLIALRLPFMKLRALSSSIRGGPKKFGQLCLPGMVINVPTDLIHIQTELPREFSVDDTVLVNIKRRSRYKGCYETENVRPYKILRALQYLTTHDTLWRDAGVQLRSEFVPLLEVDEQARAGLDAPVREIDEGPHRDVHSDDDAFFEGEEPDVHAFGDETMIDADAVLTASREPVIDVAPGEGQCPVSVYLDKHAEEMANPDIFGGRARPANHYSYKQLCRVEMRHFRRLVAQRPGNIFFKIRKLHVLDMKQLTWVRLRKSKLQGRPLQKASQLVEPEGKQQLLQANVGFRDFKQLRGTSDYDEQGKKEAFAMLRQLGPFTFFYTFSMADMKWPEFLRCLSKLVNGKDVTLEEAARFSWKEKARLVRSDPVTSARYHRHRMEALLSIMKK
jgi:hypothetical protein